MISKEYQNRKIEIEIEIEVKMIIINVLIIFVMICLAIYEIQNRRFIVENEEQINRFNNIIIDIEKNVDTEIKDIKRIYVVQAAKLRNLEEKDTLLAQQK